jgi:hypothetical protein
MTLIRNLVTFGNFHLTTFVLQLALLLHTGKLLMVRLGIEYFEYE